MLFGHIFKTLATKVSKWKRKALPQFICGEIKMQTGFTEEINPRVFMYTKVHRAGEHPLIFFTYGDFGDHNPHHAVVKIINNLNVIPSELRFAKIKLMPRGPSSACEVIWQDGETFGPYALQKMDEIVSLPPQVRETFTRLWIDRGMPTPQLAEQMA